VVVIARLKARATSVGRGFSRAAPAVAVALLMFVGAAAAPPAEPGEAATATYFASIRDQPSLLLAFLAQMPKGGDLHNHLILGINGSRHPLRTYLKYGVPVALVTDDGGVSRSTLTLEFRKAVDERGLDYRTLKRMARNSLEYSFADAATKARLRADLEEAFRAFERTHDR
jgi:hypothetical protein